MKTRKLSAAAFTAVLSSLVLSGCFLDGGDGSNGVRLTQPDSNTGSGGNTGSGDSSSHPNGEWSGRLDPDYTQAFGVPAMTQPADLALSKSSAISWTFQRDSTSYELTPTNSVAAVDGLAGMKIMSYEDYSSSDNMLHISIINPDDVNNNLDWNYQTFGTWDQGDDNFLFGYFSVGSVTPGNDMPTSGTATYTGIAASSLNAPDNIAFGVKSDLTVTADFGTRSLAFSTANSQKMADPDSHPANSGWQAANDLNLTGSAQWGAGSSSFQGTDLHNSDNTLSNGKIAGNFYGPNAAEVGGTISASGSAGQLIGGFGAKKN